MFGNLSALTDALPKVLEMIPQAQEFMSEWIKFMHHLTGKVNRIDERTETIDSKVSLLLTKEEPHSAPEIFSDVLAMSRDDPRIRDLKPAWVGENGKSTYFQHIQ